MNEYHLFLSTKKNTNNDNKKFIKEKKKEHLKERET